MDFVRVKELASRIGAAETVTEYESRCTAIGSREHTGVVITGGSNCGKTTILNGITGVTLREASNIPGDGQPLRVCFEKMEDLEGFECKTVLNKRWNAESAILYEMQLSDLIDENGRKTQLADLADVVFFVISALTPFTREDVDALKALSPLCVRVVLNKLNLVREADRAKVEEYVKGFCARFGTGDPLVIRGDDWDAAAEKFRDALPISSELARYRENHAGAVYRDAVNAVLEQAQRQLDALRADMAAAEDSRLEEALEQQRKQAEGKLLKAEMLETGAAHCANLREDIMAGEAAVAEKLLAAGKASGFSEKWFEKELAQQMRLEMEAIVEAYIPQIEAFMRRDCEEMIKHALQRGLATADTACRIDFEPLTRIGVDSDHTDRLHDAIEKGSAQMVRANKVPANMKLLIGTATACALVYLISPSALLTFVPAGIGGVLMGIDGQSRKTVEWSKALAYYTQKNLSNLSDAMEEAVRSYYDILAETMIGKIRELPAAKADTECCRQEEEKLSDVILGCRTLLRSK